MIVINPQEASKHKEIIEQIERSGVPYEIDPLFNLTDFAILGLNENVCIERKAINDFWQSVKDGRLWSQAKDLSKYAENNFVPVLIIELSQLNDFVYNPKTKRWKYVSTVLFKENEIAFYNAQWGLSKFGVHVILTSSPEGTARFLVALNKKLGEPKEKKEYPERHGFKRNMTLDEKKLYLMEAFGLETAKALIREFGSIGKLVDICLKDEAEAKRKISELRLQSGRRIGESKAVEIIEVLTK